MEDLQDVIEYVDAKALSVILRPETIFDLQYNDLKCLTVSHVKAIADVIGFDAWKQRSNGHKCNAYGSLVFNACKFNCDTEVVKYLVLQGFSMHLYWSSAWLCRHGNLELLKFMHDTAQNKFLNPHCLFEACRHGHGHVVNWLVEHDMLPSMYCGSGLVAAIEFGNLTIADYLVKQGMSLTKENIPTFRKTGIMQVQYSSADLRSVFIMNQQRESVLKWLWKNGLTWDEEYVRKDINVVTPQSENAIQFLVKMAAELG